MRWPLRRSSPECRKAHRVTTAPEADGERRVSSRLGRPPTRWEPGPALAIVVSARGKGRVGGKREPGKRRKPGAFAGGATHDAVPTTACGTPDVTGATVVTNSCAFYLAHEAADASSIRRSARPHLRAEERGLRAPPRRHNNRGDGAWLQFPPPCGEGIGGLRPPSLTPMRCIGYGEAEAGVGVKRVDHFPHPARCSLRSQRATLPTRGREKANENAKF
jgi:hypothetical protein